ncbi:MAG: type II toxin-antitoxin system RelE/ParE family toxin [Eubacteriales bacterium]|nr:type II toxin-antitoxin system RelE/ParE family toxin [Eubacteriales bacterium]MDD3073283.1 type II toxin-antitoxin system RelE/ParE family toxin [Eubacteriales bacterium]MDD4079122.1 type II toxin-antitoxin system RelE/ParE family toxin [Eubacteriales bacterium]MDD4768825.1 type II toxin-antitoxin system RelE/ParE family toxin [Eubacteriales bacterium]
MASYELRFKESVAKDLRLIPAKDIKRILERIETLSTQPRPLGCEKLSAKEKYRLRQGDYRIIYEIRDDDCVVIIVKIGHRRNVYQSWGAD